MKTILQYTGYRVPGGGVLGVIRILAAEQRFHSVLGVSPSFPAVAESSLARWVGPPVEGEEISPANIILARRVACAVQPWLQADPERIFHGHSRAGLLVALWLHWWREPRVVVSIHCYGRQRWFYRWAANRLGRQLFWLSPAMRDYYGVPGLGWEQCIPEGVPPSDVVPLAPVPATLRLGGIGTLVPWKGWHVVVAALARLNPTERARVTFKHIGSGDEGYRLRLERRVADSGLTQQVDFSGPAPSSARLLGEIDVLVIASDHEPFSLAMLEALAAGVPVLAADSGGARDIIQTGVNGRMYPAGDAQALAEAIRAWLRQPMSVDRAGIRATARMAADAAEDWAGVYGRL